MKLALTAASSALSASAASGPQRPAASRQLSLVEMWSRLLPHPEVQQPQPLGPLPKSLCFRRYLKVSLEDNGQEQQETQDLPFCYLVPLQGQYEAVPVLFASVYKAEQWGVRRFVDAKLLTQHKTMQALTAALDAARIPLCEDTEIAQVTAEHLRQWRTKYPGCLLVLDETDKTDEDEDKKVFVWFGADGREVQ